MKNYFLLLAAGMLCFLLNACTKAEGTHTPALEKGVLTLDGETYFLGTTLATVDKAGKQLSISLTGQQGEEKQPGLLISIAEFTGEGTYPFSENVQVHSTGSRNGWPWSSEGCAGKVTISQAEGGDMAGTVEGYLSIPDGASFIPTSVKSSFRFTATDL